MIQLAGRLKYCLHPVIGLLLAGSVQAADIRETARSVAEQSKGALVTVRVVMGIEFSIRGQSRDQERKIEANGTVIDASGLTVASAAALDPTIMMRATTRADIKSQFKETTLILDDGTEVDAEVILKDSDLDMIFIKPREADVAFKSVALDTNPRQPRILDQVFAVGRLGKIGNRAIRLHLGRVEARVKGPRPLLRVRRFPLRQSGLHRLRLPGSTAGHSRYQAKSRRHVRPRFPPERQSIDPAHPENHGRPGRDGRTGP